MVNQSWARDGWADIAKKPEEDIREYILTGYRSGRPFTLHDLPLLESTQVDSMLDFGCGLGRNFDKMRSLGAESYAYDLPEMITSCKKFCDTSDVTLLDTWDAILDNRYDVTIAILVLQHIADPVEFLKIMVNLSRCSTYLYLCSRVYVDGTLENVLSTILSTRQWSVVSSSEPAEPLLDYAHPSEHHYDVILRTENAEQQTWSEDRQPIMFVGRE